MKRHLLFLVAAAGSVGVPMMTSSSKMEDAFPNSAAVDPANVDSASMLEDGSVRQAGFGADLADANAGQAQLASTSEIVSGESSAGHVVSRRFLAGSSLTGPEVISFAELFRFDITTDWILQRWTRVSTATEQPTLQGYRIPVVTGTQPHDLAGSLTYYFNSQRQLQRIVFHGTSGEARPLVEFVTARHGLTPQETEHAGLQLLQRKWHGKAVSEMRVLPTSIVRQSDKFARYDVHLLLERPEDDKMFKGRRGSGPSWKLEP